MRQLRSMDWLTGRWLTSRPQRGKITQRVKLNESLDPRIIYVAHAWWFPEREGLGWKESNDNMLTKWDGPKCQAMGAVTLRGIPCKVYPT